MADTYAQYIIVETKMVLGKPLVQSTQIFRSCPLGAGVIIAYIFCSRHIYHDYETDEVLVVGLAVYSYT